MAVPYFNIIFLIAVLGFTKPRPRRTRFPGFWDPTSSDSSAGEPQSRLATETPHAPAQSAGGTLSIAELTRCHAVVGQIELWIKCATYVNLNDLRVMINRVTKTWWIWGFWSMPNLFLQV